MGKVYQNPATEQELDSFFINCVRISRIWRNCPMESSNGLFRVGGLGKKEGVSIRNMRKLGLDCFFLVFTTHSFMDYQSNANAGNDPAHMPNLQCYVLHWKQFSRGSQLSAGF